MKLRLLPIILLAPATLFAQEPHARNGLKLGLSMASQTSGGFLAWSGLPKFGPVVGWSFEVPVTNQISALLEPMYMSKGSYSMNAALKTSTSVSLSYLEMPLMLKISTNPDPQGLFLSAGILYGYFLRGRVKNYYDGDLVSEYDYAATQANSQWSAGLGIGVEKGNWMWEVRGQNSVRLFSPLQYVHSVVFSGQVCWRFPLERKKKKHGEEEEEDGGK